MKRVNEAYQDGYVNRRPVGVESGHTRMAKWSNAVLRTIAVLDAVLSLFGFYFIVMSVWGGTFSLGYKAEAPYFRTAFVAMTTANLIFLILFLVSAFQLFRVRRSGVIVHAIASAALIVYNLSVGMFWISRSPVGRSIASATGVGNMGIAPFQLFNLAPFVYPILSTALLFLASRKTRAKVPAGNDIGA